MQDDAVWNVSLLTGDLKNNQAFFLQDLFIYLYSEIIGIFSIMKE